MAHSIACPICGGSSGAMVKDSRLNDDGSYIRRRRQCGECGNRFGTIEVAIETEETPQEVKDKLKSRAAYVPIGMTVKRANEVLRWWLSRPKDQD